MIKKPALLLLLMAIGSVSVLVYSAYRQVPDSLTNEAGPVKCSGSCQKKGAPPHQWNIISHTFFQQES